MKRARFVAPARRELLEEVAYYNNIELGPPRSGKMTPLSIAHPGA